MIERKNHFIEKSPFYQMNIRSQTRLHNEIGFCDGYLQSLYYFMDQVNLFFS